VIRASYITTPLTTAKKFYFRILAKNKNLYVVSFAIWEFSNENEISRFLPHKTLFLFYFFHLIMIYISNVVGLGQGL